MFIRFKKLLFLVLQIDGELLNQNRIIEVLIDHIHDDRHPFIVVGLAEEIEDNAMKILQLFLVEIERRLVDQLNLAKSAKSCFICKGIRKYQHWLDQNDYLMFELFIDMLDLIQFRQF